jgi:glycogen debranching enzyme
MSVQPAIPFEELIEAPPPSEERSPMQLFEPRKVNNLTLVDGKTFLSTTVAGDIVPPGAPDVGFFHDDTRFLSHLELRVGGQRAVMLSSGTHRGFASQIELTTGSVVLQDSLSLPDHTVHIRRQQLLACGVLYSRLLFENFHFANVEVAVDLSYDADFVDVFQVRGCARAASGRYFRPVVRGDTLIFSYLGRDGVMRQTVVRFVPRPAQLAERSAMWHLRLEPLQRQQLEISVTPWVDGNPGGPGVKDLSAGVRRRREEYGRWESECTRIRTSHELFDASIHTAVSDLHALSVPEGQQRVLAAGIPWFATLFGRDSIISAYQALAVNPSIAADTLRVLARYQGTEVDDLHDEQPGKILHELRAGEMTRSGEMPFGPYYGSVDATPLFLILLSETYNWTGDVALVRELLPAAYRALDWIEHYGDADHDGFVEYARRSARGLANQGWKDSWDAMMHRDGSLAQSPIAPAEVQGYVYDAKYRMASLLRALGDMERAERLRKDAMELARRFEKVFWMSGRGFYAMALDGEKKKLEVIASNPGHLLFTRIIGKERARAVVERLMKEDMDSGWGFRTLSSAERIFNPLSYHRGSVWPHDNSLIVHGMALHGFLPQALRVLTTLFHAALNFRDYRLPELFCGVQRHEDEAPVHYPVSCSPQAWASGAMFLMLTSVLGIRPSAPRRELNIVNPALPDWLDLVQLRGLRVGQSRIALDFTRRGERTFCNVVSVEGEKLVVNVVFKK